VKVNSRTLNQVKLNQLLWTRHSRQASLITVKKVSRSIAVTYTLCAKETGWQFQLLLHMEDYDPWLTQTIFFLPQDKIQGEDPLWD
jgi:hypothetical protein